MQITRPGAHTISGVEQRAPSPSPNSSSSNSDTVSELSISKPAFLRASSAGYSSPASATTPTSRPTASASVAENAAPVVASSGFRPSFSGLWSAASSIMSTVAQTGGMGRRQSSKRDSTASIASVGAGDWTSDMIAKKSKVLLVWDTTPLQLLESLEG